MGAKVSGKGVDADSGPFRGRLPVVVFPPLLGLFGLGLAWRRAALSPLGLPEAAGELILGAVSLLYAFFLALYMLKFLRRPAVIRDDLAAPAGRAGSAAMLLCLYLAAAAVLPHSAPLAEALFWAGLALHLGLVILLVGVLLSGPPEGRRITPVWHLSFVGFILAAPIAPALGHIGIGFVLFLTMAALAGLIWSAEVEALGAALPPAPLRPLLAIHMAPAAVLGLTANVMGLVIMAHIFAVIAAAMMLALILTLRWATRSGFSPLWGAFTFPLTAAASLWLSLGGFWFWPGAATLAAASLAVPVIAFRVLRLWAGGRLAGAMAPRP